MCAVFTRSMMGHITVTAQEIKVSLTSRFHARNNSEAMRFRSRQFTEKPILVAPVSQKHLQDICDDLNSEEHPEYRLELRSLVQKWDASGRNLQKMLYADLDLWTRLQRAYTYRWLPSRTARAHVLMRPNPAYIKPSQATGLLSAADNALLDFGALVLNPSCINLLGPCPRCGMYYLKKRRAPKIYCSQRCGSRTTAARRSKEKWDLDHAKKLSGAVRDGKKCPRRIKTEVDWKTWLSARTGLTIKWLTRAINKGELAPPARCDRPVGSPRKVTIKRLLEQGRPTSSVDQTD
jgi:hypothetical protein